MEQSPSKSVSDENAPENSGESTPESDGPPITTHKRDRFLWGVLPVALLLVVSAFFVSEAAKSQNDVQIGAPFYAQVGRELPLFAFHFGEGHGELGGAEFVEVNLVGAGESLAETTLVPGDIVGYFGQLPAVDVAGEYELHAEAMPRREPPETVTRRLVLEEAPEQVTLRGRRQTELQRWEPGSVVSLSDAEEPEHLDARVSGGACVPGEDCVLLVWVGEPAAAIGLVRSGGIEPIQNEECGEASSQGSAPNEVFSLQGGGLQTSGVVRCSLRVAASEGHLRIIAFRDGAAVAERPLQLPIGFATPLVDIDSAHLTEGQRPHFVSDEETLVATLYEDALLREIQLVGPNPTFDGPLTEGLWRAQFRRDAFGSEHVATRLFVVHDHPLSYLAAHPSQRRWLDPMARERPSCEGAPCSTERLVRFMLAAGELEVAPAPTTSSGKVQALTLRTTEGSSRRLLAVGLVLFAGLLVAWAIYRRGIRSSARTRERLQAASADMPASAKADKRASLSAGIFVFLVFAAVAALVFSRGCVVVFG